MAKTPSNTAGSNPASTPAPAAVPVTAPVQTKAGAVASARGPVIPPETPTELQRGVDAFADVFADLAGGSPEPEKSKEPKASEERRESNPEPQASADTAKPEGGSAGEDDDPILGEDSAEGDGTEDDAGEGKDKNGYEEKLFKAREKRRELEAELKAEREQREALQAKVQELATAKAPAAVKLEGAYQGVTKADDVPQVTAWLDERMDMMENFLEGGDESFTEVIDGKEVERTREWARAHKQWVRSEQRKAAGIEASLRAAETLVTQAETQARKRYPFVFDPHSKHNQVVLDLVKEDPSLNSLPSKPLALGRMALGKMVEDAAPEVRRQIATLLAGKAVQPAAPVPPPVKQAATKSVPSPASSAPRARVEPDEDASDLHRRLISGDKRAAEEWAAHLFG